MFVGATVLENLPLAYSKTLSSCDSYSLLRAVPKDTVLLCDIGRLELQAKSIVISNKTGAILISNDPINLSIIIDIRCPCIVVHSRKARDLLSYARSRTPFGNIVLITLFKCCEIHVDEKVL